MKIPLFILVTLLGMCVVIGIAFVTPQVPFEDVLREDGSVERIIKSHGFAHGSYPSMDQGGPGAERHEKTLWVGWAFVSLSVLFFTGCLLLGAARHGKLGPTRVPFLIGTAVFLLIFTALIFSYRSYMLEDAHSLFLSFPRPTAWMLLAVWPFPLFFMALYYVFFDSWHFTKEDEERLEELLSRRSRSAGGDS